jgi:hypothetical protein
VSGDPGDEAFAPEAEVRTGRANCSCFSGVAKLDPPGGNRGRIALIDTTAREQCGNSGCCGPTWPDKELGQVRLVSPAVNVAPPSDAVLVRLNSIQQAARRFLKVLQPPLLYVVVLAVRLGRRNVRRAQTE